MTVSEQNCMRTLVERCFKACHQTHLANEVAAKLIEDTEMLNEIMHTKHLPQLRTQKCLMRSMLTSRTGRPIQKNEIFVQGSRRTVMYPNAVKQQDLNAKVQEGLKPNVQKPSLKEKMHGDLRHNHL